MFLDNTITAFISQGDLSIIAMNCTVEKNIRPDPESNYELCGPGQVS